MYTFSVVVPTYCYCVCVRVRIFIYININELMKSNTQTASSVINSSVLIDDMKTFVYLTFCYFGNIHYVRLIYVPGFKYVIIFVFIKKISDVPLSCVFIVDTILLS